jgi:hypothetical protein
MKKGINLLLILAVISLTIASISFVSANIITPASITNSNQSINFATTWNFINITGNENGVTNPLVANTTFYWNGTGAFVAVTKTGLSFNNTVVSATLTISSMSDGVGSLRLIVGNQTALNNTMVDTGRFRVDTTSPTETVSSSNAVNLLQRDSLTFTWAGADTGTGVKNSSFSLTSPDASNCPTLTSTTTSSSQTISDDTSKCIGNYIASTIVCDYVDKCTTTSLTVSIAERGSIVYNPQTVSPNIVSSSGISMTWIFIIIGALLLAIILVVVVLFATGVLG